MDSITQAVLGAGVAGVMLGRQNGRKAVVAGAALATLPDLDVIIRYADPVTAMFSHRGFSHSVFVLTALAAALTWCASWAARRGRPQSYRDRWLFLTIWLIFVTHVLLDAFTSYGTQLWWPLMPTPTQWASIFIIDPLFTIPLLIAVLIALIIGPTTKVRRGLLWAMIFCATYLGASLLAKNFIENRVLKHLHDDGAKIVDVFATPQPFSILLWRVVARTDDDHYIEAISGLLDNSPPERISQPLNSQLGEHIKSPQMQGLRWFSNNWLRHDDIGGQLVTTDLRMGLGAGYYSFRFKMGERQADGTWQAVLPTRWPSERGKSALLATIQRIWQETPPLPLATWATRMQQPAN